MKNNICPECGGDTRRVHSMALVSANLECTVCGHVIDKITNASHLHPVKPPRSKDSQAWYERSKDNLKKLNERAVKKPNVQEAI